MHMGGADAVIENELPANAPKPGEIFAAEYRVERLLGVGGVGYVFAARQLATGGRVERVVHKGVMQRDESRANRSVSAM